ncbi:hypothetical protein ACIBHX_31235 [Nonomuraea sp. NPDC050536]|uniref:hypothetical protein n=1 Tax=Nonomuraea sp. NPDC050536 TaxID=3364366 RepID=UPI0037CC921A
MPNVTETAAYYTDPDGDGWFTTRDGGRRLRVVAAPTRRLVRPDQHVAWSGPDDSRALEVLRMAISRAPSTSAGPSPSA